jgi:hypothetical protein
MVNRGNSYLQERENVFFLRECEKEISKLRKKKIKKM